MDSQKKIILITEDEPAMQRILADKLTTNGFGVLQASNGEEGLSLAFTKHPDLVVVDLLMPKVDGMTMINKLREDEWGKSVPIIVLTNVSPDNDAMLKTIVNTKPAYYFIKSEVKLDDIAEKIKEVLTSTHKE